MKTFKTIVGALGFVVPLALAAAPAAAEDQLKIAIGQINNWENQAPTLGQDAGIFKKHGLVLENVGTAGAGDAFCAGVLYGLHEGWDLQRCLLTGVCIAAASLADATCTAGVRLLKTSLALAKKFGFGPPLETGD